MTELTPKRCAEVSPQCEDGHEDAYRLGWWHGQIEMAEEHDGTPCQVIRLRQEIAAVEAERDRLREALSKYADPQNWWGGIEWMGGCEPEEIARAALADGER